MIVSWFIYKSKAISTIIKTKTNLSLSFHFNFPKINKWLVNAWEIDLYFSQILLHFFVEIFCFSDSIPIFISSIAHVIAKMSKWNIFRKLKKFRPWRLLHHVRVLESRALRLYFIPKKVKLSQKMNYDCTFTAHKFLIILKNI